MNEWFFDAPGGLKDFHDPSQWHQVMRDNAAEIIIDLVAAALQKKPDSVSPQDIMHVAPTLAYVNPAVTPPPQDATTTAIAPWGGFPRAVVRRAPWTEYPQNPDDPSGIFRAVEHLGDEDHRPGLFVDQDNTVLDLPVRDRQDEYLEWAVRCNPDGQITKIIFVAEGYDYFTELFDKDERRVLEIYKDFTENTSLQVDDLRAKKGVYRKLADGSKRTVAKPGSFNPRNRFNISPGIVHLSHRANSLGAEVNLAGVSGITRKDTKRNTLDSTDAERILCCSEGGNPDRNSDPLIAQQAYALVLRGNRFTLANPVGLYIAGIAEERLLQPDNRTAVPREWWKIVRGHDLWTAGQSRVLRLELEVPASENFVVGNLLVDGSPIKYAGQLADLITVHLFVTTWMRDVAGTGPVVPCIGTGCRQTGQKHIVISEGKCPEGFELAFPDLIPVQNQAMFTVTSPIIAPLDNGSATERAALRRLP